MIQLWEKWAKIANEPKMGKMKCDEWRERPNTILEERDTGECREKFGWERNKDEASQKEEFSYHFENLSNLEHFNLTYDSYTLITIEF